MITLARGAVAAGSAVLLAALGACGRTDAGGASGQPTSVAVSSATGSTGTGQGTSQPTGPSSTTPLSLGSQSPLVFEMRSGVDRRDVVMKAGTSGQVVLKYVSSSGPPTVVGDPTGLIIVKRDLDGPSESRYTFSATGRGTANVLFSLASSGPGPNPEVYLDVTAT